MDGFLSYKKSKVNLGVFDRSERELILYSLETRRLQSRFIQDRSNLLNGKRNSEKESCEELKAITNLQSLFVTFES